MNEEPLRLAMKAIEVERSVDGTWDQGYYMGDPVRTVETVTGVAKGLTAYYLPEREEEWVVAEVGCGTTMCLAGQIVHQAGFIPLVSDGEVESSQAWVCMDPESKEIMTIRLAAEKILGVGRAVGHALFERSGGITDVNALKKYVTEHTGVVFD